MNKLLFAGLMAGAWSSCAVAADLGPYNPPSPRREPIYEPVREGPWNWQGLYLGGNAGYAWGNTDVTATGPGFAGAGGVSPEGWLGGGQIGYNVQFDWLVLGVEADLQSADISDSATFGSGAGAFTQATTDIDWFSTLRGRIGYAAGPTLIYFTGGWAFANVDYGATTTTAGPTTVSMSSDGMKSGYTVGGGVEWAFAPNWSLKTEYLFVDLGKETFSSPAGTSTSDTDFHTARVGLNYHF
jgi:outer membrane immunogenic protein